MEREVTGYIVMHRPRAGAGGDGSWEWEFNELTDEDPRVELPGPGIFPMRARLVEQDGCLILAAFSAELLPPGPGLEAIEGRSEEFT